MGFTDVYDFVNGKVEWILNRLPVEGTGPHYAMVGEAATEGGLHTCVLGSTVKDSLSMMERNDESFCLVLNHQGIVLGRLRHKQLDPASEDAVEAVMETGPTTVRPNEPAGALLERMEKRKVLAVIVTTKEGTLVGVVQRRDLRRLIEESQ
jgi:CBS domain-containing protein